jgi:hypothetical protein
MKSRSIQLDSDNEKFPFEGLGLIMKSFIAEVL